MRAARVSSLSPLVCGTRWRRLEVATGEVAASCEYFSALDFYYQRQATSKDLNRRFQKLWPKVCGAFIKWLRPQLVQGPDRVRWVYEQVLAGKSKPEVAYLCKL
jgi:hypothetical protein